MRSSPFSVFVLLIKIDATSAPLHNTVTIPASFTLNINSLQPFVIPIIHFVFHNIHLLTWCLTVLTYSLGVEQYSLTRCSNVFSYSLGI